MFESDHESFINQPEPEAHVWRYMDLARYLSMLETRALHFARADQMQDRWEGAYGPLNRQLRPAIYGEHYTIMASQFAQIRASSLMSMHMSCWHLAEVESAAMWDIYQREGRGVAIQSTWGSLTKSITSERSIYGAKINYVDYTRQYISEGNIFDAFLCKRESFRHEQEVRLLTLTGRTAPHPERGNEAINLGPEPPVIPVSVDLPTMIHAVFVAPDAPSWIGELVEAVTRRYQFDFPVRQSDLAVDPIE